MRTTHLRTLLLLSIACANLTCDSPFESVTVPAAFDVAAFRELSRAVPIPGEELFIELSRVSDGEVVFSGLINPDSVEETDTEATVEVNVVLNSSPESFNLLAELGTGEVVYFRVEQVITVSATSAETAPLTPVYVGPGADATSIVFSLSDTTVAGGDSILVSADVFVDDSIVPDAPVVFYTSNSSIVEPDDIGINLAWIVAPPTVNGSVTVTARAFNQSGVLEATALLGFFPAATSLELVSGQDQLIPPSGIATQPLAVRVRDAAGGVFTRGFPVTFNVTSGPSGTVVAPLSVTTDQNGVAQTFLTAGSSNGTIQVEASASGLSGSPVTFNAIVATGTGPALVTILSGDNQTATVGSTLPVNPTVRVTNAVGAPSPGIDVVFDITGGSGSPTSDTATTDPNGDASMSGWTLGTIAGINLLEARVEGVDSVTFTANGLAASVDTLVVSSGDGQSGPAGTLLPAIIVVQALDQFGNPVNNVPITWTATSGSVNPPQGFTFGNGEAQTAWQLGTNAVTQFASAATPGISPALFAATAIFSNPTVLLALPTTNRVAAGSSEILSVSLTAPAPVGGSTVSITSDNPSLLSIGAPGSVTIAEGGTSGQITINGIAQGTTTLRGNATGYAEGTLVVDVSLQVLSMPQTLNVPFGGTTSLPLQISQPAPAGGTTVTLLSTDPSVVAVLTPVVTIPVGQSTANAIVSGVFPGTANVAGTTADFGGAQTAVSTTANLNIVPTSATINEAFGQTVNIQFESGGTAIPAPAGGVPISISSDNAACAIATSPVSIQAGLVNTTTTMTFGGSATTPCSAILTASAPDITSDQISVTVNPPPAINAGATTTAGGLVRSSSGSLGASNHGGVTVTLTSNDPSLLLVSTTPDAAGQSQIQIPMLDGTTFFSYAVHGLEGVADTGAVTAGVTVSAPGFQTQLVNHTVVQPAVAVTGVAATTTTLSSVDPFLVYIGVPNAQLSALSVELAVRPGGTPFAVTTTSSDPTVGLVDFGGTSGGSVSVGFNPTDSRQTVNLVPLTAGATTVTVAAPGFIGLPGATTTISAPAISLSTTTTGSGLSRSTSGSLGAPNHGGVTLTLTSSDPSTALLAPDANSAGANSIQIPIADGSTFFSYWVHGLEGVAADGPVTFDVTASTPGFVTQQVTHTVSLGTVSITGLVTTTTTLTPNDAFLVYLGIANAQNSALSVELPIRPGGQTETVTVVSSDGAVGDLLFNAQSGLSVDVAFAPGESRQTVEFNPIGAGTATVSATPANLGATTAAQGSNVTVTAPTINLSATTTGGGMQRSVSGSLGASNHGGVTVTLTSADPTLLLLSPNDSTVGQASLQIPIADGTTFFSYYVHGLEGVADTGAVSVDVSATAVGFVDQLVTHTVVQPAVSFSGLAQSTTSLSSADPFLVYIGLPNAQQTALSVELQVRPGGPTITGVVTSSNESVGRLTFDTQSGSSVNVTFAPRQSRQTLNLEPVAAGITTISADVGGYIITTPAQASNVTVSTPGISLSGTTTGTDLQRSISGSLGAPNHGGVTLTLTSSSGSNLLLAPDASTPGASSIQIVVPDGSTFFTYYVHGVATGTPTVTASANGFVDGLTTVSVVQPAVAISGLGTSQTAAGPADAFIAYIGLANAQQTALSVELQVRPGIPGIMGTVASSNAAIGTLTFLSQAAQSHDLNFTPGTSRQNLEFNPLQTGTTNVTFDMTGFIRTAAGAVSVTVNP